MEITPTSDQLASNPVVQHSDVNGGQNTGASFGKILGSAVNVAGQLASTVAGAQTLGLGPIAGSLLNGGSTTGSDTNSFQELIAQQERIQQESIEFTSQSNISKSNYETAIGVIRNTKTG